MYELRPLNATDLYPMLKLAGKLGIKQIKDSISEEAINKMISDKADGSEVNVMSVGIDIVFSVADVIINNLADCQDEVNTLLSRVSGKTKKEISELPLLEYTQMIFDFVQKEEFPAFIKAARELFEKLG
ncbi:MAG: hypothetical protein ACI4D0_03415 [Lachnospira sp.]